LEPGVRTRDDESEQIEEFFENRVLKPLPDYSYNPELRELAMSIQNEIINQNPSVRFHNIVGLTEAKRLLKEAVLMPMKYPHFF
jgi:katanin p60 ATPase-containing subunit A1